MSWRKTPFDQYLAAAVMPKKSFALTLIVLSLALVTELAIGLSWASSAQAKFKPPKRGVPKTTAGGGAGRRTIWKTRSGSCIREKTLLTILVPSSKTKQEDLALTTEAHPTFFLYLPKTTAQAAEFVLKDINGNDVYRSSIALPGTPGIISFRLPVDAAPLELGKYYQWHFDVVCQPDDRLNDASVAAWIGREETNQALVKALKTATPRKRPNIYAQAGIWQDTLTTLAELRLTNPKDISLTKEWSELLKSAGLDQIPESPTVRQLSPETIKIQ